MIASIITKTTKTLLVLLSSSCGVLVGCAPGPAWEETASFLGSPGCPDCPRDQVCEITSRAEKLVITGDPLDLPSLASARVYVASSMGSCDRPVDAAKVTLLPSDAAWSEVLAPCAVVAPTVAELVVVTGEEVELKLGCAYVGDS